MNCRECKRQISAYIDKELTDNESAVMSMHLSECDECVSEFNSLSELKNEMASLKGVLTAEYDQETFLKKVKAETVNKKQRLKAYSRFTPVPAGFAAAVVLLIIGYLVFSPHLNEVMPPEFKQAHNLENLNGAAMKSGNDTGGVTAVSDSVSESDVLHYAESISSGNIGYSRVSVVEYKLPTYFPFSYDGQVSDAVPVELIEAGLNYSRPVIHSPESYNASVKNAVYTRVAL